MHPNSFLLSNIEGSNVFGHFPCPQAFITSNTYQAVSLRMDLFFACLTYCSFANGAPNFLEK